MSPTTVDNRAVEMGFDNKQFESGVKQSTDSLAKLKKSLDLTESVKSINALGDAGKKFSLAEMGAGIDNISSKFSAFGVIGFTILQNLTNAAINYGRKLVSGILDPIKGGFAEYETQMNAIQTVLANTEKAGTTLTDVNAALDELNTYADKTIYNFSEMTRNIGTFTAAGVSLETSTAAIKGIANLAAVSGSNSQQASVAMYQLSQALSSGTVKLMDWNSVVNAGMGGQVFQDALKETARVSGIAIDDLIDKHGSFRETLQTGWLSSEVLLQTLEKFTGDLNEEQLKTLGYNEEQIAGILRLGQTANDAATKVKTLTQLGETLQEGLGSGWAKTWQIVVGDFEEARDLFTEISDTLGPLIEASSDARNNLLQDWKDLNGRTMLIMAIRNAFQNVLAIMAPIKEAFREIFPPLTGKNLYDMTAILFKFAQSLKISADTADKIKRIFKGVFSVFALAKDVVFALARGLFSLTSGFSGAGSGILDFLANIGDFLVGIREGTDVSAIFESTFETIQTTLDAAKTSVINFAKVVSEKFQGVKSWFESLFKSFDLDVDTSGIGTFFENIKIRFAPLSSLAKVAGFLITKLVELAKKLVPGLVKAAIGIGRFMTKFGSAIAEGLSNVDFHKIFDIINTGLIGALLLAIRNFIKSGGGALDSVSGMFGGVTEILDGVGGSLQAWQENLKAKTLLTIASAIGILTVSLVALSLIDSKKLSGAMLVITGLFIDLAASMRTFSSGVGTKTSIALISVSLALLILAGAMSKLADIDPAGMDRGIKAIFGLTAMLVIFSRTMSQNSGSILKGAIGLIAFSLALRVLVGVVDILGSMDPENMTRGLQGVGIMLAEIAIFMKIVNGSKVGVSSGLGILGIAAAILILGLSIEKLGKLNAAELQQGLIAIGAVLAELAAFMRLSGGGKGMVSTGLGMVILGGAMEILVDVISKLGKLSIKTLAKGLTAMGIALGIITAAVRAMPKNMIITAVGLIGVSIALNLLSIALSSMGDMSWEEIGKGLLVLAGSLAILTIALYAMSGTIGGSIALAIAAGALLLLTPVLATLGSMPLSEIGIALLALAGVFLVLGVAGALLTPVIPTLLGLGASMVLIGAAAALVGLGLLLFSAGLSAIAVSGAAAAVALVAMISTILGLVPLIINTLINTIIIFAEGIIRATPVVAEAITTLLLSVLQIIIDVSPKLFEALDVLLKGLIQLIEDNAPLFIAAVIRLLLLLLKRIAEKVPEFVQAGFDILIGFLEGIRDNIAEVVTVVTEIVTEFLGAVGDNLPDIVQAGWDLMLDFINALSDSVDDNLEAILTAAGELAANLIEGVVKGILGGAGAVIAALVSLVKGGKEAAQQEAEAQSPSKVFARIGETFPQGMVVGIERFAHLVPRAMGKLVDETVDSTKGISSAIVEALTDNLNMNPSIRPVLDLTEVARNGKELDNMLKTKRFNITPLIDSSSKVASSISGHLSTGSVINEGTNFNFTQNNYSPKALSRIEIYRQTNKQILTLKGLVK